jgi:hypothetical protein
LTQIFIVDGEYHVFGIKLGDPVSQGVEKLERKGYERDELWDAEGRVAFRKYGVVISLEYKLDSDLIYQITVVAPNIS